MLEFINKDGNPTNFIDFNNFDENDFANFFNQNSKSSLFNNLKENEKFRIDKTDKDSLQKKVITYGSVFNQTNYSEICSEFSSAALALLTFFF